MLYAHQKQTKPQAQTASQSNYINLDEDNLRLLARILNQMWTEESYPDDFAYAEIVSIYKKGNLELPEHYRPISLLNLAYKIMTKILQKELQTPLISL